MAGPYFRKSSWPPFVYKGTTYELIHLDEYEFSVVDTEGLQRHIAVTFADHCFTRDPVPGDDPTLAYPASDRRPVGHFSFERFGLSFGLVGHIAYAAAGEVWIAHGENYAAVPTVDQSGNPVLYGIFFSLDRVRSLPVGLHMRVRTAYPVDVKSGEMIDTFGSVRFRHLVALRMAGKSPGRIADRRRKVPRIKNLK